jgi:hypothetical protein
LKKAKFDEKQHSSSMSNAQPSALFAQTKNNTNTNNAMIAEMNTTTASSTTTQSRVVQNEIPEGFFDDSTQQV